MWIVANNLGINSYHRKVVLKNKYTEEEEDILGIGRNRIGVPD